MRRFAVVPGDPLGESARTRRPWWLVANSPGGAVGSWVFLAIQLYILVGNTLDGRLTRLGTIWLVLWGAALAALAVASVATFIALRRHPDWVNRAWPSGKLTRPALLAGAITGAVPALGGLVAAFIVRNDTAGAVSFIGFCLALVCGVPLLNAGDKAATTADQGESEVGPPAPGDR